MFTRKKFLSLEKRKRFLVMAQVLEEIQESLIKREEFISKIETFKLYFKYFKDSGIEIPFSAKIVSRDLDIIFNLKKIPYESQEYLEAVNNLYHEFLELSGISILEREFKVRTKDRNFPLYKERVPLSVILDNIRSPFNVGNIIRTSEAVRVEKVYFCGYTLYPPNKKVSKAAMGAEKYIDWEYYENGIDTIDLLKNKGITIIALETSDNSVSCFDYSFSFPMAIVVGNEEFGISHDILKKSDQIVEIPTRGYKNSLNVSVAFGIAIFQILKQWKGS
ncbi:MAG: RNA methyltransferase [Deltaproteobacteria bacterium]|nr:RNA methyltransferase [Deltaproteobacteria bacterium]